MGSFDSVRNFARAHLPFRVKLTLVRSLDTVKSLSPHMLYSFWIKYRERAGYDPARIVQSISAFRYKPKISIVMPVYDTPMGILDLAVGSVLRQHYDNWQLCICDDASPKAEARARLEGWEKQDPRIKVTYSRKNEGISGASNRALAMATGEFVGLLDHDDEITPDALYEVVKLLQEHPEADLIYSDEDRLDKKGRRVIPFLKPDWSPEYMLCLMYTLHFGVYRRRLVEQIGGFRMGYEGSQDYDLVLRLSEKTDRIYHIPKILYHWRMVEASVAASDQVKPYAYPAAKRALNEHLGRRGIAGEMVDGDWRGHYRVRFALDEADKVSIVIMATRKRDLAGNCVRIVEKTTSYRNYELIIADEGVPNLSRAINQGVARASGEYVLLLHDDTEVITPDWIHAMLGFCRQEGIGAVGGKLLYRTRKLQHVGIVLGLRGVAGFPLRGFFEYPLGFPDASRFYRNCSAVSSACMMVRKDVFERVGGFDEELAGVYADVDFCLKIREAGYRIVFTPDAELYHDERGSQNSLNGDGAARLRQRWGKKLENDPYYNPNLTLKYEDMGYRI